MSLSDQIPHVNGGVVGRAEEDSTAQGQTAGGEAGVGGGRFVAGDFLVCSDVPKAGSFVFGTEIRI